jgi:hypothetical protein
MPLNEYLSVARASKLQSPKSKKPSASQITQSNGQSNNQAELKISLFIFDIPKNWCRLLFSSAAIAGRLVSKHLESAKNASPSGIVAAPVAELRQADNTKKSVLDQRRKIRTV